MSVIADSRKSGAIARRNALNQEHGEIKRRLDKANAVLLAMDLIEFTEQYPGIYEYYYVTENEYNDEGYDNVTYIKWEAETSEEMEKAESIHGYADDQELRYSWDEDTCAAMFGHYGAARSVDWIKERLKVLEVGGGL